MICFPIRKEKMKILERFICGKHTAEDCEDGLVVTGDFAAVVDGSTSKTERRFDPAMKNGRKAMQLVCGFIKGMSAEATIDDFCRGITRLIRDEYESRGLYARMAEHPEERLTASAIVFSAFCREVWMVGDCQAIVDGSFFDNSKPYEHEIAAQRAALIRRGVPPQEARRSIEPKLVAAMLEGQNRNYAVIDGTAIFMPGVRIVSAANDVVLASDGYPVLRPSLEESEAALRLQLETDPQNISAFVATKGLVPGNVSFDDRAYIRLTV